MNCVPVGQSSGHDDLQDQLYCSLDNVNDAISGIDSLTVGTLHGPTLQDSDLDVTADGLVASRYEWSEDPFLINYDASRGVVAPAGHPPGHLMSRAYAPQLNSGLGYQGTNWRPLDTFRQHYPNTALHIGNTFVGEAISGPLTAPTPGLATYYSSPVWTRSDIPTSFAHRGPSFGFPYHIVYDSLTPEHPVAAENGATVASWADPLDLTGSTGIFEKDWNRISPLGVPPTSVANSSSSLIPPFSQQPDSATSSFTTSVPSYVPSSPNALEVDLNYATPNGSFDDVVAYTSPQPGRTFCRRRGRNQVVVSKRRKYPGLAKYFCDECSSDNDFTTPGALNRHIKSKHNGVTFLCTFVGCERMYADESSLQRHRRQCGHTCG
ncbi:hypothetical protein BDZ89DRAFT_1072089 [Hymenopellis radicata]|nr:hypothetical protein BDZ89DRAFT_1072089 [Hymenopellis radicata]